MTSRNVPTLKGRLQTSTLLRYKQWRLITLGSEAEQPGDLNERYTHDSLSRESTIRPHPQWQPTISGTPLIATSDQTLEIHWNVQVYVSVCDGTAT